MMGVFPVIHVSPLISESTATSLIWASAIAIVVYLITRAVMEVHRRDDAREREEFMLKLEHGLLNKEKK